MASHSSDNTLALYRKYRPQTFKEVIGQDHVTKVLEGAIKQGSIAHAYLFAGSRGTGKTSVARIFAREIGTSTNDLYEIDAASNRGIDDIRAIRDAVNTLPFESKYKVYIVDEAHMLTKEAFNALLKTLEEPPPHAIFILATTEIDKFPETILSRCQTFTFKKPTQEILREVIMKMGKAEGVTLEPAAADLIALLGDGSFRDAAGILQKVISSADSKKISISDVELVTGAPRGTLINDIVAGIAKKDSSKALGAIEKAVKGNVDMRILLKLLQERVRAILLLRFAPDMTTIIKDEFSAEDFSFIENLSKDKESTLGSATIIALLEASDRLGYSSIPQLPLELAIMSLVGQNN